MRTFVRYSQGDLQWSALQSGLVIKAVIAIMIVSCVGFLGCASLQAQKLAFDP